MIELMETAQPAIRIQDQCQAYTKRGAILKDFLREYSENQPRDTAIPTAGDLAAMDEYRTLFNEDPAQAITQDDFETRVAPLPEVVDAWRTSINQRLIKSLGVDAATPIKKLLDASESVLHLAATLFKCCNCSLPIGYPAVLSHQCCRRFISLTVISDETRRFVFGARKHVMEFWPTRAETTRGWVQDRPPISVCLRKGPEHNDCCRDGWFECALRLSTVPRR
jgi:hypothetical protein